MTGPGSMGPCRQQGALACYSRGSRRGVVDTVRVLVQGFCDYRPKGLRVFSGLWGCRPSRV